MCPELRPALVLQETGAPGWAEVGIPGCPARVLIKVESKEDGRYGISRLIVVGDIDSSALKAIPIARIEAWVNSNSADMGAWLQNQAPEKYGVLASAMPRFSKEFREVDDGLSAWLCEQKPPYFPPEVSSTHQPLERPDGSDPDSFYRKVAEAYGHVVRQTSTPAKVLAEESGVPVATVHRWIHETRRRGFLPPARKGRAG